MKKQHNSLDRKVQLILSKDLGDPDELKSDEKYADVEGLNALKEDDVSSGDAEEGQLLKVYVYINIKECGVLKNKKYHLDLYFLF